MKIRLKCSSGMLVTEKGKEFDQSSSLILEGLKANPFRSVSLTLGVKADLPLSKDGTFIEHRVSTVTRSVLNLPKTYRVYHFKMQKLICL